MTSENTPTIAFNGEHKPLAEAMTVSQLIAREQVTGKRFLVVFNDSFVPKSAWESTTVQAGDKVDIMTAITGG